MIAVDSEGKNGVVSLQVELFAKSDSIAKLINTLEEASDA